MKVSELNPALIFALLMLAGCGDGIPDQNGYGTDGSTSGNYFAIVGYYSGGERIYKNLGVSRLDECRDMAIAEYNAINADSSGRAFDWFCKNTHSGRIDR
jgi:hypothetical protein